MLKERKKRSHRRIFGYAVPWGEGSCILCDQERSDLLGRTRDGGLQAPRWSPEVRVPGESR